MNSANRAKREPSTGADVCNSKSWRAKRTSDSALVRASTNAQLADPARS